jgi:import inner membrane translocase subunit TIM44
MDQVKKDMESDPKLKKDWEKWQKTSADVEQKRIKNAVRMDDIGSRLKSASLKTSEVLSAMKERSDDYKAAAARRVQEATEQNESLKNMEEFMKKRYESGAAASSSVLDKGKGVFSNVMDKSSKAVDWVGGSHEQNAKLKKWKTTQAMRDEGMAATQAKAEAAEVLAKAAADAQAAAEEDPLKAAEAQAKAAEAAKAAEEMDAGSAMVVSKTQGDSSWDRFGSGIRDMPFLSNMFENPLFDRMFGESEIAASIREMKDIDSSFFLEDFAEEIETVVAPHIVQTYLDGDQDALELHCGEAAFAAVNASIKARKQNKMTLDTNILAGPKEVELKGAQRMDKGPPCFIWTFNTQQVNCLRDREGDIIEGAVDDIRTVYYAMAVTMHPELEKTLEYPWQVSELAIVGNQPCW